MIELILNADVFAPEHLGARNLLIAGERIVWVGTERPQFAAALDVRVRDLRGRRVVPGFIDGHAHITGGGGESGYASRVPEVGLSRFTRAGVTTVVGLLGTDDLNRTPGEVVARARALEAEGMSAFAWTGGYHLPLATITGSAKGDIVHVDKILGVGELAISDHRSSQPSFDEFARLASECHVAGLMTDKAGVLHLHVGDGPRGLELIQEALRTTEIPPRVFQPTHVNRRKELFEQALTVARAGVNIDVTAYPAAEEAHDDGLTARDALLAAFASGIEPARFTASSDGGGCLPTFDADGRVSHMGVGEPDSLMATLRELVLAGIPLERAVAPFTSNWAQILRLPRKGRIFAGADADLVVLDDDHRIADVLCLGRWHVLEGEVQRFGTFEARP
ncbi:MAG TPA: beta-aspartyl-peptidase [Planctomycetota bacterium]|nr:beta-aspartyl-peptidase [Planctomycetota bacterium]